MRSPRSASDWIGFVAFGGLAVVTLRAPAGVALFLLPTLAHEGLTALSFLLRAPTRRTLGGAWPRIAAYGGSFALLLFLQAARSGRPEWLTATSNDWLRTGGVLLWLCGAVLAVGALWPLRHAFSLEPAARGLVTCGPYAFARHPIYAGYLVQYAGMWLVYPTAPLAGAIAAWIALMLARVRYEERVLVSAFPAYAEYCRHVPRFCPMPRLPRPASLTRVLADVRGVETLEWIVVGALIAATAIAVLPGTLRGQLTAAVGAIGATILG